VERADLAELGNCGMERLESLDMALAGDSDNGALELPRKEWVTRQLSYSARFEGRIRGGIVAAKMVRIRHY
jgi:hypothetical protein